MKRKLFVALVVTLVLAFAVSSVLAANGRKGKRTWKKNCRVACHDGSKAKSLSPVSKKQAEWKALFTNNHAAIDKAHAGLDLGLKKPLETADWDNMFEYLNGHALDSDQPETCG